MRGTIQNVKKSASCWFFVVGNDEVYYFGTVHNLVNRKSYDKFVWNGNKVTFDPTPGDPRPVALNIVPDEVIDPDFEIKKERRRQEKLAHEANLRKKEENLRIQEEARLRKEHLDDITRYIVQVREDYDWVNMLVDGEKMICKTADYAKEYTKQMKKLYPDKRFRFRKIYVKTN